VKVYLVARVSTEEQNDALPAQTNRLVAYAEREGFEYELIEFTESAYSQNRDQFRAFIKEIKSLSEPAIIVFDKIDRYSRDSSSEDVRELRKLVRSGKLEIHFPSDNLIYNEKSPATDIMRLGLGLMLAEYYANAISDNVKRRIEQKLGAGEWITKAPFGYKHITEADGSKNIVRDGVKADAMIFAFQEYATGLRSLEEIRTEWIKRFGIKTPKSTLAYRLKNPFFYGMMESNGVLYPHKYEPLISQELFQQAEAVRNGIKTVKHRWAGLDFPYRSLIRCNECGLKVTFERHKGKYVYGHCTQFNGKHGAKYINQEVITEQFSKLFDAIKIPDEVFEEISAEMKASYKRDHASRLSKVENLKTEITRQENRLNKLHDEFFDGNINRDIFNSKTSEYQKNIASLRKSIATFELDEDESYGSVSHLLYLGNKAPELFKTADQHEKRSLIESVLSNLQLDGDQLRSEYKKPFDTMAFCAKTRDWCPGLDSNQRP